MRSNLLAGDFDLLTVQIQLILDGLQLTPLEPHPPDLPKGQNQSAERQYTCDTDQPRGERVQGLVRLSQEHWRSLAADLVRATKIACHVRARSGRPRRAIKSTQETSAPSLSCLRA